MGIVRVLHRRAWEERSRSASLQQEATAQLPPGDTWWDRFHVFSVEWTPDAYIYRVDGREIFRNTQGVSGVEEFLLLSLSTKDWELRELDPSLLPSTHAGRLGAGLAGPGSLTQHGPAPKGTGPRVRNRVSCRS